MALGPNGRLHWSSQRNDRPTGVAEAVVTPEPFFSVIPDRAKASRPSVLMTINSDLTLTGTPLPNAASDADFDEAINSEQLSHVSRLSELSWTGIPHLKRAEVWTLLLGEIPADPARRPSAREALRQQYRQRIKPYFPPLEVTVGGRTVALAGPAHLTYDADQAILWQIAQDSPRFFAEYPFFQRPQMQGVLTRVTLLYSLLHPAMGYVQGMADVLLPLMTGVLALYGIDPSVSGPASNPPDAMPDASALSASGVISGVRAQQATDGACQAVKDYFQTHSLPSGQRVAECGGQRDLTLEELADFEADTYTLYSALLVSFQSLYTPDSPHIKLLIARLEKLCSMTEPRLYQHLMADLSGFSVFSFRWFNCFLVREVPLCCSLRYIDVLTAEIASERARCSSSVISSAASFHVLLSMALLTRFSEPLLARHGLDQLMQFIQALPTRGWRVDDFDEVLAVAWLLQQKYQPEVLDASGPQNRAQQSSHIWRDAWSKPSHEI